MDNRKQGPSWNKSMEAGAAEAEKEMLRQGVCRGGQEQIKWGAGVNWA